MYRVRAWTEVLVRMLTQNTRTHKDNLLNQIGMETTMPIRNENRSKSTATTTEKKLAKIQLQHGISIMQSNVCFGGI